MGYHALLVLPSNSSGWHVVELIALCARYDVFAGEPGSIDVQKFTGAIDDRCPQTADFGVLRCTGHQHIGELPQSRSCTCSMPCQDPDQVR